MYVCVCVLAGAEPAGVPHAAARQVLLAAVSSETALGGFDTWSCLWLFSQASPVEHSATFSVEQMLGHQGFGNSSGTPLCPSVLCQLPQKLL